VVGGLVEQQHVGLLEQEPAERDAAPLTARERVDLRVGGGSAARPSRARRRGRSPSRWRLDLVLELRLLLEQLVICRRIASPSFAAELLEAVEQLLSLGDAPRRCRARLGRVELRLLRQVADAEPLAGFASPRMLLVDARHDPEQRALAGAVRRRRRSCRAGEERERGNRMNVTLIKSWYGRKENSCTARYAAISESASSMPPGCVSAA
jgi:hypothetical protein